MKVAVMIRRLVLASLIFVPFAQAADYTEDFESGEMSFGSFYKESGNPPTVTSQVARVGRFAMKSYLNRLESPVSYRTELTFNKVERDFGVQWYGFSIYLPDSYVSSPVWELVAQWHDVPNDWSKGRKNPPLLLSTRNGEWDLTNLWDSDPVQADGSFEIDGRKHWNLGPYRTGVWTDWVFRINWSYGNDGAMQVWRNGDLVVDTRGPNTYNDDVSPYMKLGIYKGWRDRYVEDTVEERVLFHDEIRIAGPDGRYEDVAPGEAGDKPAPPSLAIN